jgi:DNA-binding transcriptional ArsR family regulator
MPGARAAAHDVFHALGDPTRRKLLDLLAQGEQPVHRLARRFRVTRPAISQHLRVLREARLVREARVGRERRYRLHAAALREVHDWVSKYEAFWDARLDALGAALDRENG